MKQTRFYISFILLLIVQICICNFFRLSQFVMLSILPTMILLIPIRRNTVVTMIIAFVSALVTDLLADGMIGLNVAALVPVAFARKGLIRLVFGEEIFARKEDVSIPRQGLWKMSLAIIMAQTLFLAIYIILDGAGTRPAWFGFARYGASLAVGYVLSLFVADILSPERNSGSRR